MTHAARRIGEKKFVFGLGLGVIAFQLLAWFVPNVSKISCCYLGQIHAFDIETLTVPLRIWLTYVSPGFRSLAIQVSKSLKDISYVANEWPVAVSILGLLLGPICPCAQTVWARLLPTRVQVFAIGFISSAGSSGGAIVPFLTGLLAQVVGTYVLHPICIGFCVIMLGFWAALPRLVKRKE